MPLLLGLPILAGATALIGVGESVWVLLASRLFQGFSTSVTWTVGLALTRDTAGKDEVGQWMGTALSSSSVGLIISPLLGGIVFASAGIWGVLGMMIGLVFLNVVFVTLMVEKRVAGRYVVIVGESSARYQGGSYGTFNGKGFHHTKGRFAGEDPKMCRNRLHSNTSDSDPEASSSSCLGDETDGQSWDAASTFPEAETEPRVQPMLRLLRSPRVLTGAYGVFTQFGLLASFDAFLPLFVERRFGWGSLGAGLIFLNIAIPALCGPLAGKISDRYGPRRVALAGCILTAPPLFLMRYVGYNSREQIALLCSLLVLVGMGSQQDGSDIVQLADMGRFLLDAHHLATRGRLVFRRRPDGD